MDVKEFRSIHPGSKVVVVPDGDGRGWELFSVLRTTPSGGVVSWNGGGLYDFEQLRLPTEEDLARHATNEKARMDRADQYQRDYAIVAGVFGLSRSPGGMMSEHFMDTCSSVRLYTLLSVATELLALREEVARLRGGE